MTVNGGTVTPSRWSRSRRRDWSLEALSVRWVDLQEIGFLTKFFSFQERKNITKPCSRADFPPGNWLVVETWHKILWIFKREKLKISEQAQSGCWRSTNSVWKNFRSWKAWSKIFTGSLCCHSLIWSVRKIDLNYWSRSIQMNFNFNWNLDFQVYWPDPRARTVPLQRLQRPEEAVDGCKIRIPISTTITVTNTWNMLWESKIRIPIENITSNVLLSPIHCDVRISTSNISM